MELSVEQRQAIFFGGRDSFLSHLLWCKLLEKKNEPSGFFLVTKNGYSYYREGMVYPALKYMSNILPGDYLELTWGEFYRWYGDWKCEEAILDEEGIRTVEDIIEENNTKEG